MPPLLGERPLAEISVDQPAKGAGTSRPTFYAYFESKERVLLALFDRVIEEARSNRGDALPRLAEGEEQGWREAIGPFCKTFAAHRAIASAAWAAQHTSAAVKELWSQVMEQFVAEVTAAIEAERRHGAAPKGTPARDLATSLNWMVERALFSTFSGQTPAVDEERPAGHTGVGLHGRYLPAFQRLNRHTAGGARPDCAVRNWPPSPASASTTARAWMVPGVASRNVIAQERARAMSSATSSSPPGEHRISRMRSQVPSRSLPRVAVRVSRRVSRRASMGSLRVSTKPSV
jgi:AcrR family transcriptional regulator